MRAKGKSPAEATPTKPPDRAVAAPRNEDIARAFDETADILEIEEENPFRVRAYRNAARTLRSLGEEAADMVSRGANLADLPGIGEDLAAQIAEMVSSGHLKRLDSLRPTAPALPLALARLPGLGPKRAVRLCQALRPKPKTLEDILAACREGRVAGLPGFGPKSQRTLMERLSADLQRQTRYKLASVEAYAAAVLANLRDVEGLEKIEAAGSYRRRRETVGDLDFVATSRSPAKVIERFTSMPETATTLAAGPTKASVVLKSGIQVDLRVVAPASYGAALLYFTGSKAHNIALRRMAQERDLKINEYGVYRGADSIAGGTEASVYQALGLSYIEPELREATGEIEAAARHDLPKLVSLADVKGDLHAHTSATDGMNTLEEMARAARDRGLEYLAITDHSRRLTVAHGLDADRLRRQGEAIDKLNAQMRGFTILKGIEVDILKDGTLDLPDDALKRLDLVVAAIHSDFALPREKQTERILRALDNKYVTVLAHPTGRLLLERDPYDIDMPRIMRAARERGCFLEINAHPDRLDLCDAHCRMAKSEGVKLSLGTDAHRVGDLANLAFGIDQARRGWLEAKDIVNTRSVRELKGLLSAARRPEEEGGQ
ncbi:MAG TPA: DNA polymerase/3'-5' exonuclease PolX [Roseiarcus sp.]|nr:DNA polymerase/3'-5' exonuclease PolX [Roseiarcus sp.]